MRELLTTREVVRELGGIKAVAQLCGVKYNAVTMWHSNNIIPPRHSWLRKTLRKRGYDAPEKLWGMREPQKAAE